MKPILLLTILLLVFIVAPTPNGLSIFGLTIPGLCLFKTVFHVDCPVCGMTRSVTSAGHLRFAESFNFHPLGIPFLAGVVMYAVYLLITKSPLVPLFQRGKAYNTFLQRGMRGDLAVYRGMSKLFSTALLLVWAYKILKEVYLWH